MVQTCYNFLPAYLQSDGTTIVRYRLQIHLTDSHFCKKIAILGLHSSGWFFLTNHLWEDNSNLVGSSIWPISETEEKKMQKKFIQVKMTKVWTYYTIILTVPLFVVVCFQENIFYQQADELTKLCDELTIIHCNFQLKQRFRLQ